jgi:hypothetical protein
MPVVPRRIRAAIQAIRGGRDKRRPSVGRAPTLILSLADFENTTREEIFDEALRQGLAVGFEQSPYIQILSDRKSALILKQMARSPDERLTGQMAIELCQRAAAR